MSTAVLELDRAEARREFDEPIREIFEDAAEPPMGFLSNYVAGELFKRVKLHCEENRLGWVSPSDAGFQCFPWDAKHYRKPDVSFIRLDRLPADRFPEGHVKLAPDMAAEVVSPNDDANYLEEKIHDYLAVNTHLVWVLYPRTRTIYIFRPDGTANRLTEDQELTGEGVIPGFRCRVGDLFPVRPAVEITAPPS